MTAISNIKRHIYDLKQRIAMLKNMGEKEALTIMQMKLEAGKRFVRR